MIEKYKRLVWCVAKAMQRTYKLSSADVEDIVADINLKLFKLPADAHEGTIRISINNTARTALNLIMSRGGHKVNWRQYSTVSYDEPSAPDGGMDCIEICGSTSEMDIDALSIRLALKKLNELDQLLIQRYSEGYTAAEIGEMAGIPTSMANYRIRLALQKLAKIVN